MTNIKNFPEWKIGQEIESENHTHYIVITDISIAGNYTAQRPTIMITYEWFEGKHYTGRETVSIQNAIQNLLND